MEVANDAAVEFDQSVDEFSADLGVRPVAVADYAPLIGEVPGQLLSAR